MDIAPRPNHSLQLTLPSFILNYVVIETHYVITLYTESFYYL